MESNLASAEFDMDKIRNYREREMMANIYRKVNAYDSLLDNTIALPPERQREVFHRYMSGVLEGKVCQFQHSI